MKAPITKFVATSQTPVFQAVIPKHITKLPPATTSPSPDKRDNTFSKSRDTREDRGSRQMKTTNNSQTFFQICALL
jgi:hypothetical protein